MRPRQFMVVSAAVVATLSLSSCGGGSGGYPTGSGTPDPPPGGQPPATTAAITVKNNFFDPSATTVAVGTTVTWTWDACRDDGYGSTTCVVHGIAFDGGGEATARSTGTWSRQFNSVGTFTYRCSVHGASMTGQVIVR